jgi:hypothetical protein
MTSQKSASRTSTRHRTDYLSLIFGLLFLAVAGWWAAAYFLDWSISVRLPDAGWMLAIGLILLGLIGIVASLRRDRGDAEAHSDVPSRGGVESHRGGESSGGIGSRADGDAPGGGGPSAGERSGEAEPLAPGGRGADPDQPTAGDPGGHRPE